MTALMGCAVGVIAAAGGGGLDTTVTVGSDQYAVTSGTSADPCFAYGYGVSGANYLSLTPTFGSMAEDTYIDGGANSRTISAIYYTEVCSGSNDDNLYFGLDQTSVADSDAAFVSIDYNGQNYTRASRNVYHATLGGATTWIWTNITPNGPTGGTPALVVNI